MRVTNVHRRPVADHAAVARLIDALASEHDGLWPKDRWPPLRLDHPLQAGAKGGHGPIRYWVDLYEPGKRVRFRFERPKGFDGFHEFVLVHAARSAELVHVLDARMTGLARLSWPLLYRPLHDAVIEDALGNAQRATGALADESAWSPYVRFLRRALTARRRAPVRTANS